MENVRQCKIWRGPVPRLPTAKTSGAGEKEKEKVSEREKLEKEGGGGRGAYFWTSVSWRCYLCLILTDGGGDVLVVEKIWVFAAIES